LGIAISFHFLEWIFLFLSSPPHQKRATSCKFLTKFLPQLIYSRVRILSLFHSNARVFH
jgi:hypothetical protein